MRRDVDDLRDCLRIVNALGFSEGSLEGFLEGDKTLTESQRKGIEHGLKLIREAIEACERVMERRFSEELQ